MTETSQPNESWLGLLDQVYKAYATRALAGRVKWRGLDLSIEQMPGDVRRGVDPDGKAWETKMQMAYGYVRGTSAVDGDHLDVFVDLEGIKKDRSEEKEMVWVVHTINVTSGDYDEDKCFIGFDSQTDALTAFQEHYDDPFKHFGAVTAVTAADFEAYCKAGRQNWGRPLCSHIPARIAINRRRLDKRRKQRDERKSWLKAMATKAREVENPKPLDEVEKSVALLAEAVAVSKAKPISDEGGRRLILIEPGFDAIDPQGDWIPLSAIAHAWAYYEVSGNIDLEHISKKGGDTYEQRCAAIKAQGFEPKGRFARIQYDIGRPVKNSIWVRLEDGSELRGTAALKSYEGQNLPVVAMSYVGEIYKNNEAADWFWHTWTAQEPPMPWRPSVAGSVLAVEVMLESNDPVLSIKGKRKTKITRRFMWSNTAMTLEPVNYMVPEIRALSPEETRELRARQVLKSVTMFDDSDTTSSLEVIKAVMLKAAFAALSDMHDSDQIDASQLAQMTGEITKSVETLAEETFTAEVSKGMSYGAITTDSAQLTQGGAMSRESLDGDDNKPHLTDFRRELIAREFHKATVAGFSPISKAVGYEAPEDPEDFMAEIGDCVQTNYDCNTDDALAIAGRFIELLLGRE